MIAVLNMHKNKEIINLSSLSDKTTFFASDYDGEKISVFERNEGKWYDNQSHTH